MGIWVSNGADEKCGHNVNTIYAETAVCQPSGYLFDSANTKFGRRDAFTFSKHKIGGGFKCEKASASSPTITSELKNVTKNIILHTENRVYSNTKYYFYWINIESAINQEDDTFRHTITANQTLLNLSCQLEMQTLYV